MRVLFLCSRNRWRSPTAEEVFAGYPGVECASAGLASDAVYPLSADLVAWADLLFVMERQHRRLLEQRFHEPLAGKRVVCLDIPDRYAFMDPELVRRLRARVTPHLPAIPLG